MSLALDSAALTLVLEAVGLVLHVVVIGAVLLSRRRESSATLAWILFIVFAPLVGVLVYLVIGRTRMRRTVRRSADAEAWMQRVLSERNVRNRLLARGTPSMQERTLAQISLGNALTLMPASSGNAASVLIDAAATYREMLEAIVQAVDHIHVQFYIIQPDAIGVALRDELTAKAAAGVEVRVLCDAVGSYALPSSFWEPLRKAGGKAAFFGAFAKFLPRMRRRDRADFRNHRKIVVVDGKLGFTGGINVGREYLGLDPSVGAWRDTHVRIEGPAVLCLQQAFLHDWLMTTEEELEAVRYFPEIPALGECLVQVIDSGPDQNWPSMELYHAQAIAMARERVWITNPYFVPSQPILAALTVAALRGVDVRLLLPKKSDMWIVTLASHSHYAELLNAKVRIFEYARGFVHAKTMVVDEWLGTVGSANMDMRSFTLNFELNAFFFSSSLCRDLASQFLHDLEAAFEVSAEQERQRGLVSRLGIALARLLSPLL